MNKQITYIQTSTFRSIFILCFLVFSVIAAHSQPLFTKKFSGSAVPGGVVTLTFTIDNSAGVASATSLDFTDNLPAGVTIANPVNASTTCTTGTLTAVSGSGVISYTGGTVGAGTICEISVDVTSSTVGMHVNTSGDLTSSAGNSGTASAILIVAEPELDITLTDSISYDPSMDMIANPKDTIKYTLRIENTGDTSVYNLGIDRGSDPNTTLDPSTIQATPVAINDIYELMGSPMNVPMGIGLLANDADVNDPLPNPPYNDNLTVLSAQGASPGSPQATANGGTVTVNTDGSFVYDSTGVATAIADSFFYKIIDTEGFADSARVVIFWTRPPVAQNDGLIATVNIVNTYPGGTLFNDNGNGTDDLGIPAGNLVSFGGGDAGGTVATNVAGSTVAFAGGMLTVNAGGGFTLSNPTLSGNFTFQYKLENIIGSSVATVNITVIEAPVAHSDSYTFLFSANQIVSVGAGLFVDNGSGADELGFPTATLTSFGGGSLGGAVTDHAAGASIALANGTLTVNADGSWSLTGQPFTPGNYTFNYRIENVAGTSDATVTLLIQDPPVAQPDALSAAVNIVNSFAAGTLYADNGSGADHLGTPAATIVNFGGGDAGGTVATNAAGASVPLAGGTLKVNADGSLVLSNPTMSGIFSFDYRIQNSVGTSDATVTLTINEPPVAQSDSYTFLFSANQNVSAGAGLFVDNGSEADELGFPSATLTYFGGGSLGGAVTDHAAGASIALANGTLTVNADGSWSLTGQPFTPGNYTFNYRIENVAGTSDATVTLMIQDPPIAQPDALTATVNIVNNFLAGSLYADNGSGADHLGTPAATIVNFGGGDAGGTVATNAAGASVALAGGTLTVNADGGLVLSNPTMSGIFTFEYRIQNSVGTSDATVTITIQGPPDGKDDSDATVIAGTSGPGDNDFHISGGTSSIGVINVYADNSFGADDLGLPSATTDPPANVINNVVLAGLTDAGTGTIGGGSFTIGGTGSLEITTSGDLNLTPPAGFAGLIEFDYILANSIGTDATPATVTLAVGSRPGAVADVYNATGNISINTTIVSGNDLLANDLGDNITVTMVQGSAMNIGMATATSDGGSVVVQANGEFHYTPPTGFTGNDTFTYTVGNGFGNSSQATVTIMVSDLIYFMDDAAAASGDGSLAKPYQSIAEHNGAPPAANSYLFIKDNGNSYSGNLTLGSGQTVIGEGSTGTLFGMGSLTGITLATLSTNMTYSTTGMNSDRPQIVNPGGSAVTLNSGNTITGLSIGNRMTYAFTDNGASVGTLSLKESEVTGTGGGVKIENGGTLDINLTNLSTSGGSYGLWLKNTSGSVMVSGGTITNPIASAITVDGGSVDFTFTSSSISQSVNTNTVSVLGGHSGVLTYSGTINTTNGNGLQFNNADGQYNFNSTVTLNGGDAGIDIVGGSGGSFTFSNTTITNPSGTAFNVSNSNANVNYSGGNITQNTTASGVVVNSNTSIVKIGAQLNLNTGTHPGIDVSGGGTIEITNSNNSVKTTSITAITIDATTIGASGVTLKSVSSNGASRGIYLNNAGPASGGFFTVTGTGTADGTGGTIQNITNRGVEIVNTDKVTLKNMNFTNVGTMNGSGTCDGLDNIGCNAGIYGAQSDDIVLDNLLLNGGVQIGINGKDINNWSLANSTVQGFGNQINEHGIYMRELTGNVVINSSTIKTSAERNVLIKTSSGSLNFISNSATYSQTSMTLGADGLEFGINGTATATIDIDDCNFLQNRTNGLQVLVEGNASVTQCDVTNSIFDTISGPGIAMDLASANNGLLKFNVIGNPKIYSNRGPAVNIFSADNALVEGRINDNPDIQVGGTRTSGIGIRVNINDRARGIVQINNNKVGNIGWDIGIDAVARLRSIGSACRTGCTDGRLDVLITNNTVALADSLGLYDIRTQAQDENTVCAYVANNTTSNVGVKAFRSRTNDANATMIHQGFDTSATTTWASNGNTPTTPGAVSDSHSVGVVTGGTCTVPSNPMP